MRHLQLALSAFALMLATATVANATAQNSNKTNAERQGKVFSLFNVISFQNAACRSTSAISSGSSSLYRNGTCYTAAECSSKGGASAGMCASGFGVCCIFTVTASGSTITQNNTYIRNPGFPSSYAATSALTYTIQKCNPSICFLRLDFESFTILGTGNTAEFNSLVTPNLAGGLCQDFFQVTTTSGFNVPTICGQNAGQHIYVDLGALGSDTATLNFQFSSTVTSSNRQWEIKVSQIPCGSQYTPPQGCLQWNYGSLTGRFTTFNFIPTADTHLRNQRYSSCIRQEEGFCCVQYQVCTDPNSFSLSSGNKAVADQKAMPDSVCTIDYIALPETSGTCTTATSTATLTDKYCFKLNPQAMKVTNIPVCSCSAPFYIGVYTDNLNDKGAVGTANVAQSRGTCLVWMQVPCGAAGQ